jgi:hypothetical protein
MTKKKKYPKSNIDETTADLLRLLVPTRDWKRKTAKELARLLGSASVTHCFQISDLQKWCRDISVYILGLGESGWRKCKRQIWRKLEKKTEDERWEWQRESPKKRSKTS